MKIKGAILILFITVLSCKAETETAVQNDIPGDYFVLEEDRIKIFLPVYFRQFSADAYDTLIDELPESEEKEIERKRFNYLKYSKGNVYYFKDITSSTLISVKMGPYVPFTKEESTWLLTNLSHSCNTYAELLGLNCEKLMAGYSGNNKTSVFKASYKITGYTNTSSFNTMYLISSNYKTFSLNIFSNNNKNYNAFIEKIVVL